MVVDEIVKGKIADKIWFFEESRLLMSKSKSSDRASHSLSKHEIVEEVKGRLGVWF